MKVQSIIVALLLLASQSSFGEQTYPAYKIPPDSMLTYDSSKEVPGYAYFSGKATIRAKYTFVFHPEDNKEFAGIVLEPDSESIEALPYLTERKTDEVPKKIVVSNTERAVELLLGSEKAEELRGSDYPSVNGDAVFVIDNFAAGFECDQAVFLASVEVVTKVIHVAKLGEVRESELC